MNEKVFFRHCPFCGAEIIPFICKSQEPRYWANGLWFLENTHDSTCPLCHNELFGELHFGRADNGEPTDSLRNFAKKWNRRAK